MTVSPASPIRLPSLTGCRVLLSVAVFLTHALASAQFADTPMPGRGAAPRPGNE
jgi:peptidoglycan/LPS O-acetylase OafA/YrhL